MMRGLALCLGLLALSGAQAHAGDTASLNVIGFSANTEYFSFEEYGVQDGSGFPYSNFFIVDIARDTFAEGTPVRMRIDEEAPLSAVRALLSAKVKQTVDRLGFVEDPGTVLVHNPSSEIDSDPLNVDFWPFIHNPPAGVAQSLQLTQVELPVPDACKDYTEKFYGFRLTIKAKDDPGPGLAVHEDKTVPRSRGCVNGYRIAGVVSSRLEQTTSVAMIEISTFGFEGNDGRFMAVPLNGGDPAP